MTSFKNILTSIKDQIQTITINRPEKMNALNILTLDEIKTAIQQAINDETVRGIIITGSGEKAFVAGADISEIANVEEGQAKKLSENGQHIFSLIENCPKPVVAAVNGFALGGGCELAMACHIRVASDNAKFGLPEVTLGIIPGYGGTQRMTALIGKGKSLELMMTADMISAAEAKEIGLVNHVTIQPELIDRAEEILKKIAQRAPLAIAGVIKSANSFSNNTQGYATEAASFGECCKTEDFKEGTKAFLEKRKAEFKGK
ncbi:MAG TPA: enoyl-CoA hydratase-related protein [Cytophagaceae bacterium]|jgi:enoyl-CoA hydratase|nr:enoyl-CoA hydratase-related protein [Cytophagaceae bacterium]